MKNRGTNKKRAVKKNVSNSLSLLWILPIALFFGCDHKEKFKEGTKEVSGAYYDWTMSMKPETPWNHEYDQTLVMKIFLCSRTGEGEGDRVNLKFDDALEVIKKADHLTLGIPKIVYLVGWQYNGHDSKYPSWSEVNKSLKREEDSSALESLKWLMKEAKKYNTTISLHINMINAFKDLPLWDTYLENDIIAKDEQGNPIKGEPFMGMDSYQISYTQEWKLGYAQQRIYGLVKMLPELKDAGTGHIDAFHSIRPKAVRDDGSHEKMSPFLGYSTEEEIATQRKIFRYWMEHVIDVTSEGGMYWLREDPFKGLQPMAWHYQLKNFVDEDWKNKPKDFTTLPSNLYCGTPMHGEDIIMAYAENLTGMKEQFSTKVVGWYFDNNRSFPNKEDFRTQVDDESTFGPALWLDRTMVAYRKKGYTGKTWQIPSPWKEVKNGNIMLDLGANEAITANFNLTKLKS